MRFRDATIRQKLTWMSVLASTIALLVAGSAFLGYHLASTRRTLIRSLTLRADIIGLNSVSALRFNDDRSAEDMLSALRADDKILSAEIYAGDGTRFAAYAVPGVRAASIAPTVAPQQADETRFDIRTLEVYHAISADGERLGTVHLSYSIADLYSDAALFAALGPLVLAVSVLVSMFAVFRIQRSFTEPIARLAKAATAVSHDQNYAVRIEPTQNRDELGVLINTFNEMLVQIQARDIEVQAGNDRFQRLNERLEERVQRRTAELEATNKELEAFTYSVSHDLRAPLRRIDGFANLLVSDHSAQLSEEAARYLSRVREGTRHMGELVDDLLNLARLGRKELNLRVTGLSAIVDSVASVLKRESIGREVEWRIQPLPFVACDPSLMDVVFTNLLANALKYTRPRAHATIEVGSAEQNGQPVIYVRDNGVGFSMKYADKLFGVFQRLHRAEDFEGTGVGLATVQRIIHKHGGAIWAEAELDKGACFYFTIGTRPTRPAAAG